MKLSKIPNKKSLLFILPNLESGGAERVILTLLKKFDRYKFELHLAVVNSQGKFFREVPEDIFFHDLRSVRVRKALWPLLRLIRSLQPKIVFSTLGHLNLSIILLKPFLPQGTKLLIRETSISSYNLRTLPYSWVWKGFYRILYNRADTIICSCDLMIDDLAQHFGVSKNKMVRIYNPLEIEAIQRQADQGENPFQFCEEGPHVIGAGRLSAEKGFDRLIQAFPALLTKKPEAKLWILGGGEMEEELKKLIIKLGLYGKVFLVGFQSNPFIWFKYADLFVLPSRFEGLPNILLEALACGCPIVALHHPGGTEEVLKKLGLEQRYVPSLEAWSSAWWERISLGFEQKLFNNFNILNIIQEYEVLLN